MAMACLSVIRRVGIRNGSRPAWVSGEMEVWWVRRVRQGEMGKLGEDESPAALAELDGDVLAWHVVSLWLVAGYERRCGRLPVSVYRSILVGVSSVGEYIYTVDVWQRRSMVMVTMGEQETALPNPLCVRAFPTHTGVDNRSKPSAAAASAGACAASAQTLPVPCPNFRPTFDAYLHFTGRWDQMRCGAVRRGVARLCCWLINPTHMSFPFLPRHLFRCTFYFHHSSEITRTRRTSPAISPRKQNYSSTSRVWAWSTLLKVHGKRESAPSLVSTDQHRALASPVVWTRTRSPNVTNPYQEQCKSRPRPRPNAGPRVLYLFLKGSHIESVEAWELGLAPFLLARCPSPNHLSLLSIGLADRELAIPISICECCPWPGPTGHDARTKRKEGPPWYSLASNHPLCLPVASQP